MNVLILTPDAVGSTLLQRLITIYMQFHEFDRPVINLHELTNGLEKFYSPDFNRELLCKPRQGQHWGYHQSLQEIVEILESVDHYKTARLAEYHINARQDTVADQIPFYQYLNENFFIISCRRRNLFEHALSWGLNKITKKLNVYSTEEKVHSFYDIYKNKVELDLVAFEQTLNRYRSYLQWSENNFTIGSYFDYDDHINEIEKYILNLPCFAAHNKKITWEDTFDIKFKDWNLCHYYRSNIGAIALDATDKYLSLKNSVDRSETSVLPLQKNILDNIPSDQQSHLKQHFKNYRDAAAAINKMQEIGILVSPVPIKKQTFAEKQYMIKNFNQCLSIYNKWAEQNSDIAAPVSTDKVDSTITNEKEIWSNKSTDFSKSGQPPLLSNN